MSIYSDKKAARRELLQQQELKYPGFWAMFHKVVPHVPESKRLLIADLIKVYIEPKKG